MQIVKKARLVFIHLFFTLILSLQRARSSFLQHGPGYITPERSARLDLPNSGRNVPALRVGGTTE